MYRKIHVTAAEMLEMREQGMSNHDIAKSLDISVATVKRYIGAQGQRMERLAAFADAKPEPKKKETAEAPVIPQYDPKPVLEKFLVRDTMIELDNESQIVTLMSDSGEIVMSYSDIPDLVQFLAWAMRKRMDVT